MAEITDVPLELKRRYKNYRNNDISDVSHEESFPYFLGRKVYYITTVNSIDKTRFEIIWTDYIAIRDLPYIKDDDFNAFGVWIPKNIILEVFSFHKDNNDAFSLLVKKYSFIHLIFLQWITIKLFYKHKEITNNHTLTYKDFMESNFTFTYDNKIIDIYQAIDGINIEEINDKEYTAIDGLSAVGYGSLTVYDIIYDIIPNSIKRVFLHNIDMIKTYLPINQDDFMYKEVEIRSAEKIHKDIYGEDIPFNASNIPKEWYVLHALTTTSAIIYDSDLLVPKAIINTYGKGYNEIVEMIGNDENSLKYPEIWEFEDEDAPELQEYDEEGNASGFFTKRVLGHKHKATWEDVITINSSFDPYADSYLLLYSGEVWDRGVAYVSSNEIQQIAASQYYNIYTLVINNNFSTTNKCGIFENARKKIRESEPEFSLVDISGRYTCSISCQYASEHALNKYLIYRFNQILAMMFINAYNKDK